MDWPLGFLLTWSCYGQRLHGDAKGSVDRAHNRYGTPLVPRSDSRRAYETSLLEHDPFRLTDDMRRMVRDALVERCKFKRTPLIAINVRVTHVHLVVEAQQEPGILAGGFKARATRVLRERGLVGEESHVWTAKGSNKWLFTLDAIERAMWYVLDEQGPRDEFAVRGTRY